MTSSPRLRELTWPDIPAVAALEAAVFGPEAWSQATWWSELAARPHRVYALLEDHEPAAEHPSVTLPLPDGSPTRPAGYAGLGVSGDVADVMTIVVAPGCRGRGYGRALLDWLTAAATAAGAATLMLEVRADNAGALGLYRGSGFGTVAVRPRYYQPSDVDAVVMSRRLV